MSAEGTLAFVKTATTSVRTASIASTGAPDSSAMAREQT